MIREGAVTVNGRVLKPSHEIAPGDEVVLVVPELKPAEAEAQDLPLTLLHEDEDLAVLDKASGMVVHPGSGNDDGTVVNALLHRFGALSSVGGVQRPGIVHRLDKETSGCLVVARNDATHQALSRQFAERSTEKSYLAVVQGIPAIKKGLIENEMGRNPANRLQMAVLPAGKGKPAITGYEVLAVHAGDALVRCDLHTGRTHQIRVHMKHLGHPLLGDEIYARVARQANRVPRMMLHAWRLAFVHPSTGKNMRFEAPIPAEFRPWLPADGLR